MKSDIGKNENKLSSLLSSALFGSQQPSLINEESALVWKEAYAQGVAVLAFSCVDVSSLQETLQNEVKFYNKNLFARNIQIISAHAVLHALMSKADIPYTILKGYASAMYYPDSILRSMGDVDFLINEEYLEKASEILISQGFSMSHENHDYHRVFQKGIVRLEMHIEPSGIPEGESGEIIREYLCDTIGSSRLVNSDFGAMMVPSVFHHGLIILIHTAHHLTSGGVGLRHLCDWAVFVNSLSDKEFCELFEEKLKKAGLWNFACVLTKTVSKYLGCEEKEWANDADSELCEEIIKDIFAAGNFGQKDEKRSQESLLISGGKKKKKSVISQLFASMNSIVYQKWRIARRLKFLLPIGWLFFGGRYLIRMAMGKRPKIHPIEAKTEAEQRMQIYDKLKLYEKDNE